MISRRLQIAPVLIGLSLLVLLMMGAVPASSSRLQEATTTETPATQMTPTIVATETFTPTVGAIETVTATITATETASGIAEPTKPAFGKADVDKIFPPGRGQDLLFTGCVNCHPWVPIVLVQGTAERWQRIMKDHRARVGMSADDYAFLTQYLIENFGPDKPVPDNIPPDLLQQWTSY